VHSRTLVTAGVYVLLRYNPHEYEWLLVLGSVTMLIAGLCACAEMDLKKIVALRTLSQLGVMAVALGLRLKELCFFHLMTHALFKALLFLCVGVFIHNTYGGQDYRSFSGLAKAARGASTLAATANLSLLGFPFLAGFFRKDLILEGSYNRSAGFLGLLMFLFGVGLTTAYRVKMIALAMPGRGTDGAVALGGGGWGRRVKGPIHLLGLGAVFGGVVLQRGRCPVSLGGLDKRLPLVMIIIGVGRGVIVRGVRISYLSSMWHLTPAFQRLREAAATGRAAAEVDGGAAAAAGAPGILALGLSRQLYAAAWLAVL